MNLEGKTYRLGDVADVSWGDTNTTKSAYVSDGYPAYSASGHDGFLPYADFEKTGVVVSAIGANCGKTWLAKGQWSCIKNTIRMWSKSPLLDTEYLYWLSTRNNFFPIRGSAQPFISQGDARAVSINLPAISDQKAIAHILGALDDKIELNQRMNQTLEDIAKAIFKSWFVDFDPVRAKAEGRSTGLPDEINDLFPDAFEDSEIGDIPAGWEVVPFTRTFQFFSGGTPKTSIPEYWNGDIPWFSIADLNGGSPWVVRTEKSITELGLSKCSARLIEKGTTIVTARGTVGKVALAAQDMAINQSCYAMRALEGWSFGWLYLQTLALVDRLKANAHGSVFDTITRETFERFHVLMPCAAIMEIFHDTVTPLFERILCADNENLILSELRDTLLPKLISGELRIPDAEKFLAEAGI